MKAIEECWTAEKGAAVKARCRLSWPRYQRNLQIWCQQWDAEEGKYLDRRVGEGWLDVPFPQMKYGASKNKVKELHAGLQETLGVQLDIEAPHHPVNTDDDTDDERRDEKRVARVRIPAKVQVGRKLESLLKEKRVDQARTLEVCACLPACPKCRCSFHLFSL